MFIKNTMFNVNIHFVILIDNKKNEKSNLKLYT